MKEGEWKPSAQSADLLQWAPGKNQENIDLAEKLSRVYVGKHAMLAQKMRILHRARTILESIW